MKAGVLASGGGTNLQSLIDHWQQGALARGEKAIIGEGGWYFYRPGLNYMLARQTAQPVNATNDPVAAIVDLHHQLG